MREALQQALERRRSGPIGSRLQQLYVGDRSGIGLATATTFWGHQMEVVLPELVSCELHRYGLIEPPLTALFVEVVTAGTVVYDVGAQFGYYSVLAAELGAQVHAFEPARQTLPSLQRNVGGEVAVVHAGLWNEPTMLELKDFGSRHSAVNTFLSVKDEELDEPEATYQVEVTTLDAYAEAARAVPDLVKIDAEGAELQVLQGARTTLTSHRPLVTVEVGDTPRYRTSRRALDFALELRYLPFDLCETGVRRHELRDDYTYGNVLLVPEETSDRWPQDAR